ncbi:MANSC domain-containing protein 4 [Cynoglossus semilaevis]|uniref:MANSC domain containing 4 n=1 Tax=Cynoglossus semilaevis TaxID=244447 RepID=A0A3P8VGJ8_CYNSE|nr:MANSC domain-containing protein 4 [Cynoglossus semilaevis]
MNVTWGLLTVLSVVCHTESRCSPTTYYKNCWIRRFPGIFIDIAESQRRGAQLLRSYQEETALKCSRTCCLTRNFSCNLAIFHYDVTHENVNCFHLNCPTLESCILSHRGNVVLYNITKGVDPDLLVFGKYLTSNVRVLPHHYSRANASEPLPPDKRQFIHPPLPPAPQMTPSTTKPSTTTGRVLTTTAADTTAYSPTQPVTPTIASPSTSPASLLDSGNTLPPTSSGFVASTLATSSSPITDTTLHESTPETPTVSTTATALASTVTSAHLHATTSSQSTASPQPNTGSMENTAVSIHYPNDTKDTLGRNHTAGDEGVSGEDPTGLGPEWHVAVHTLLVAVGVCVTVLLSCCCSVLLVVSWRGRRRRKGRYRTEWRGKRGSMRLIKYVLVRESS